MSHPSALRAFAAVRWIWPEAYCYLYNHYAQFRRDFELAESPKRVLLYITADKNYRLYVNGQYVCRGPARGYQSHWPYDEVDIARHLRCGHNWIAVEAYNPGISTFQYLHQNYAGFLCATEDEALSAAWKDAPWIMRRDPARATQTARLSIQTDFQEHIDLRVDDRSWIVGETPPADWVADLFGPRGHNKLDYPFGMPPFDTVEPRGIPLLSEDQWATPTGITSHATGVCGADYRTWRNVNWPFVREAEQIKDWGDGSDVASRIESDERVLTLEPTAPGQFRAITVAVGEYALGTVAVTVDAAVGGEILDFNHYQFLRDGKPAFLAPGDGCLAAMGNRLTLRAGANTHEFFHPLGFGHFTIVARDVTRPLTLRLRIRKVGYPFAMRGQFECSERLLNDIHSAARRTQQLCASDAYMDTPWREQAQWWGDARVQARNTFYLDGDARLLARGVKSIGDQPLACGLTPGHAPTSSYWCILPDFSLTWILTVWDHYWQTGELTLFRSQYSRIKRLLAYFDTPEARHACGLLRHDKRFWLFEDWAALPKDDIPTFLNLWYCVALQHLAKLLDAAGKARDAARYREQADRHAARVVDHCFDTSTGLFRPALDADLNPCGEPSVHDQTLALMLNLRPESHPGMIDQILLPYLRGQKLAGAVASAFWSAYVLEQMIDRGYGEEVLAFIRRGWAPMLATGTTWEGFDWRETSGGSACHAWSGHPCYHFVNLLAGIRQTAAGWRGISVKPFAAAGISDVRALIPSPLGDISVEWHMAHGDLCGTVTAPPQVDVELSGSGLERR